MLKLVQEEFALNYITTIREKDPGIGGKKLWYMYRRDFKCNHPLGRDRFEDLIDKYGLKVRNRIRKPRTTDSTHGLPLYPDQTKSLIVTRPNQLWVSDITYITIYPDEQHYYFCYLSLILDAYTEEIIGWSVGPTLDTSYPLEALKMALRRLDGMKPDDINLIHHSDRGVQYASQRYVQVLKDHGIKVSMTESGNPKDNPQAERINNTMKNELFKDKRFRSIDEVVNAVKQAVCFYNEERPHMSIGMMTLQEAAEHTGEQQKCWISYKQQHIKEKLINESSNTSILQAQQGPCVSMKTT